MVCFQTRNEIFIPFIVILIFALVTIVCSDALCKNINFSVTENGTVKYLNVQRNDSLGINYVKCQYDSAKRKVTIESNISGGHVADNFAVGFFYTLQTILEKIEVVSLSLIVKEIRRSDLKYLQNLSSLTIVYPIKMENDSLADIDCKIQFRLYIHCTSNKDKFVLSSLQMKMKIWMIIIRGCSDHYKCTFAKCTNETGGMCNYHFETDSNANPNTSNIIIINNSNCTNKLFATTRLTGASSKTTQERKLFTTSRRAGHTSRSTVTNKLFETTGYSLSTNDTNQHSEISQLTILIFIFSNFVTVSTISVIALWLHCRQYSARENRNRELSIRNSISSKNYGLAI